MMQSRVCVNIRCGWDTKSYDPNIFFLSQLSQQRPLNLFDFATDCVDISC